MRKYSLLFSVLLLTACAAESDRLFQPLLPTQIFGEWKLVSFADNVKTPYAVTIEFNSELTDSGNYTIKGKSPVNFYYATFDADLTTKKMQLFGVGSTKIPGNEAAIDFEKNYYELLATVVAYEISADGQTLTLNLKPEENQHIKFIR